MAQPQLYDFETDPLESQLATARALRKKGMEDTGGLVSGIYVGDAGSRFMNSLAGSAMEDTAHRGLGDVQRRRDEEYQSALGRRPSMMMDEATPGTPAVTQEFPGADSMGGEGSAPMTAEITPGVLPTTRKVMKPYQQQQQEQMDWATGLGKIKHPMAQALAAQAQKEAWDIPEKGMARDEARQAREHEAKLRADAALQLKREADARKAEQDAMYKRTAEQQEAILRATLANKGGSADLDRQLKQLKIDAEQAKIDEKKGKVTDAREQSGKLLDQFEANLGILEKGKGITKSGEGFLKNTPAWIQSTALGQTLGKIGGTTNQRARNNLQNIAVNLLLELKNAKGLSATQMNSNMELQTYLTAIAGGSDYDVDTMRDIVARSRDILRVGKGDSSSSEGVPSGWNADEWNALTADEKASLRK